MNTTKRCRKTALAVTALLFFAAPAFAQTDAERVDELETRMTSLAAELAALKGELEDAKQASSATDLETLRADVDSANQAAIKATQSAAK
jgi:type II secretory pathway component PulM